MADIREDLAYTTEHEWVSVDGKIATIGITDYAQELLNEVVSVELPDVGEAVELAEQISVVESVNETREIYSPVSGKIVEVNEELEESPATINSHPFDDGWLVKIRLSDETEVEDLMTADEYADYVDGLE